MNICLECGKVFEDSEISHWKEDRGEYCGERAYENVSGCPYCKGDFREAIKCESCGEYFTLDELDENHLCEDCREDDEDYICLKLNI